MNDNNRPDAAPAEDDGTYVSPALNLAFYLPLPARKAAEVWRVHGHFDVEWDVDDEQRGVSTATFYPVFAVNVGSGELVELDPHHPEDIDAFAERYFHADTTKWKGDEMQELMTEYAAAEYQARLARGARYAEATQARAPEWNWSEES